MMKAREARKIFNFTLKWSQVLTADAQNVSHELRELLMAFRENVAKLSCFYLKRIGQTNWT